MRKTYQFLRALGRYRQRLRADWADIAYYAEDNRRLPATNATRVVLLGDSITEAWPTADPSLFSDPGGYIGRGIGGQTSSQLLRRFAPDVLALKPAVVVIMAGTNDVAENTGPYWPSYTLRNLATMADIARAHGITPILSSVLPASAFDWRPFIAPASQILALNKCLRAYATQHNLLYIDYHAALADAHQGLAAVYSHDGVHPTEEGYRMMRPLLLQAVTAALSSLTVELVQSV